MWREREGVEPPEDIARGHQGLPPSGLKFYGSCADRYWPVVASAVLFVPEVHRVPPGTGRW